MKTLKLPIAKTPATLTRRLFKLERCGKYQKALEGLTDIWPDLEALPLVDGFETADAAEMYLRCGSLIGFHGHNDQIPDAQSICKNLVTVAHELFGELDDLEKVADCENNLALAYWRTGEINEAEAYIAASFAHDIPAHSDTRLHSYVIASLINLASKKYTENLEYLKLFEDGFRPFASAYLNGSLCLNIGVAQKNLGDLPGALTSIELAQYYFQRAGHKIYLGMVENNLAQLYKETGKFRRAHEAIDNATRIFKQLKDKTREGFSFDTKALIYFAESKYDEALRSVEKGLSILRKSENTAYVIETLLTKAKILLHLDRFSDAVLNLSDAVALARVQSGDKAALRLVNEFETALSAKNAPASKKNIEADDLELILPSSIAHFNDYRGIWISNTRLESIGLVKGSLAIVVKADISRGDLVALMEIENDEVSCGFYDADFGIVCLEGAEGEPQIFNETEVRVLGKIVGVCNSGRDADGKMAVESLNI